jgi:hypothetical protein
MHIIDAIFSPVEGGRRNSHLSKKAEAALLCGLRDNAGKGQQKD